ncbi:ImmA/IrrE family metallo-endopeptidase [Streptococcus ruminantium]|uniref:ImmA/IrrE family metallo-endopeptidase n=1 Tax=Streptococcus ruminantium TaxID=1917441 RepID=A0ABU1B7L0_9STRE|nr:ImmA/IrrE family metallo-endopeptidase [Streptococcus ruminantium]MDQ8759073.1 ImmA/IrrE family metallo-endopeptidase [Streptococcus ruminantium]MDQ8769989.1 ImmA/IrrE family metallo-endopeptidase [Streptococcus ruminantium]MDQ8775498.1 ImmA/IrrE family metallo-endopeptidase [Streptococcus ruminantium]MDQ8794434.1 ImmA/IrrE family metallo-endopeptidase [Streptococcus ruminantium]MDQ8796669.1 ImmA/IrrE family metallo-endopeptidase [Streptococcus ruminantium]
MLNLQNTIKETEKLGLTVLFCQLPHSKGRFDNTLGFPCIYVHKNLTDNEKIQIILHERAHYLNGDHNNSLSTIPTYSHRIEHEAEKDRIIDFLNLVNTEYPVDENFNYLDYMQKAYIPTKYEHFVRELATELYHENIKKTSAT